MVCSSLSLLLFILDYNSSISLSLSVSEEESFAILLVLLPFLYSLILPLISICSSLPPLLSFPFLSFYHYHLSPFLFSFHPPPLSYLSFTISCYAPSGPVKLMKGSVASTSRRKRSIGKDPIDRSLSATIPKLAKLDEDKKIVTPNPPVS